MDAAIPAIVTNWNETQLLDRASPEFKQAGTRQQLDQLFHGFARLGHLKKYESAQGHARMSTTTQASKRVGLSTTRKQPFTMEQP